MGDVPRNKLEFGREAPKFPKQRQTNEYIEILVQLYFIEVLKEQIVAPRLLQGLIEGTRPDLPLGG